MDLEHIKMVRFGPFELDLESEELRQDGEPLMVQPQPLRVLALLIGHHGKLMSREDLQKQVWGEESFHDGRDHSLNHTIRKLRLVLGDSARNPSFIQTVPRRGYRFIAKTDVDQHSAPRGSRGALGSARGALGSARGTLGSARGAPGSASADFSLPVAEGAGDGPLCLRVMPFRDIVEHGPRPPLADGTVEELISALVRLQDRGVFVIDAAPLNQSQSDPIASDRAHPGIAGERDFRLRGAVRATSGHVRVHAHLVRSRDDRVVGTTVFEERFEEGLFELQRTIAERIVDVLVEPLLAAPSSESAEARPET